MNSNAPEGLSTCTRVFTFDSGHRVVGHQGKCRHLHGHTYRAEVACAARAHNKLGMVIDFSEVKSRVGAFVEGSLDHNMILNPDDPILRYFTREHQDMIHGRIPFVMPKEYPNPTAENIARVLLEKGCENLAPVGIVCLHVRLWETPNCFADYYHPEYFAHTQVAHLFRRTQPCPSE